MENRTGVNDIDREIERLEKLKELKETMKNVGWIDGEKEPAAPAGGEMKSRQEEGNDAYTIRGAIVEGKNEVRTYGERGDGRVQAIAFAYKIKGREQLYDGFLVADAWNDTLRYNAFEVGEEYDLDLRLTGRKGRDGRWFGGVSIQKARRVWLDGELERK